MPAKLVGISCDSSTVYSSGNTITLTSDSPDTVMVGMEAKNKSILSTSKDIISAHVRPGTPGKDQF